MKHAHAFANRDTWQKVEPKTTMKRKFRYFYTHETVSVVVESFVDRKVTRIGYLYTRIHHSCLMLALDSSSV